MHSNILSEKQVELLPLLKKYKKNYYLVGGTAIALHIGHRRSIDFDLFTAKPINFTSIKKDISVIPLQKQLLVQLKDQVHFIINEVKLTFFEFPFAIESNTAYQEYFIMPDLITLSAMKAFALNGRGKWKDYVDLYFKEPFYCGGSCNESEGYF